MQITMIQVLAHSIFERRESADGKKKLDWTFLSPYKEFYNESNAYQIHGISEILLLVVHYHVISLWHGSSALSSWEIRQEGLGREKRIES